MLLPAEDGWSLSVNELVACLDNGLESMKDYMSDSLQKSRAVECPVG
jgi:hypothetical protein